jgi:hypothetical protein
MNFQRLAIFPFLAAIVPAAIMLGIETVSTRQIALRVEIETVKALALVGSIIAARAFHRGDYLRRGWLLIGSHYGVLLLRDLLYTFWLDRNGGDATQYFATALILLANVCAVTGIWIMSRTLQVAGIALPGSPSRRAAVTWAGVVVALAIAGPSLYFDVNLAMSGDSRALVFIVSGVGDVFALALIAPVLLTAIALSGGLLRWPWGLLTASLLGWLLYDASGMMRHFISFDPVRVTMWSEMFRCLACTFCFSAGIAQRAVSDA